MRRFYEDDDLPVGPGFDTFFWTLIALAGLVIVAGMFWVGTAGAETRPDYAGLTADQTPDVTHVEFTGHGTARIAGTIPAGSGQWVAATFHVPNPDDWHNGQTMSDTIGVPAGTFDLTLNCQPGAAQVDVWLAGQDEVYAAATTLDCGTQDATQEPDGTLSPAVEPQLAGGGAEGPAFVSLVLSPAAQDVPVVASAAAADTSSGEVPPLAAATIATLPNTGRSPVGLVVLGLVVLFVGVLAVCGGAIRKDQRS